MDNKCTYEEIFKQNENRIHYHIHKLRRDPYNEFYVEGLYAMWLAYKNYQPDSTFNLLQFCDSESID
ncbi:hypothetical protein ACFSTA_20295 [Ornithinibacillus salinisoli]|uniref:Uncharacterized protein n=1 Tax=Ornithinibacillus salinisoli TaxID=1848459 RepID=A0ABW4W5I6_9BACI